MKTLDVATMQSHDAEASARIGATELMRRAGRAAAALARELHQAESFSRVIAFAGTGNNGGDAFAACAEIQAFLPCTVYAASAGKLSDARLDAVNRAREAGVKIVPLPATVEGAHATVLPQSLILDGLLGIGGRPDTSAFAMIIETINAANATVIALDIPSGIDGTTGLPAEPATLRATHTLCFGFVKIGVLQPAACEYTGAIYLAEIGMPALAQDAQPSDAAGTFDMLSPLEAQTLLPKRAGNADKYTAGAPLVVAGSAAYPGAAVLCTRGAARTGAGYVTVVTEAVADVRAHCIEQVAVACDFTKLNPPPPQLTKALDKCSALAIGPGVSAEPAVADGIRAVIEKANVPMVIDAGALRALRDHLGILRRLPCVLTPHAGEFAHLLGIEHLSEARRVPELIGFVEKTGITTLLKGSPTLIAAIDEQTQSVRLFVNPTGTGHLATAGTGDVLTGIIATLLSQGLRPVDAARVGAYLHGLAGRSAGRARERGVIAGDVAEALAEVWPQLRTAAGRQSQSEYFRIDDIVPPPTPCD